MCEGKPPTISTQLQRTDLYRLFHFVLSSLSTEQTEQITVGEATQSDLLVPRDKLGMEKELLLRQAGLRVALGFLFSCHVAPRRQLPDAYPTPGFRRIRLGLDVGPNHGNDCGHAQTHGQDQAQGII